MQIQEVIDRIKNYHQNVWHGKLLDPKTTRDQILYGNPDQECTGVITSCWASVDVIKRAAEKGANLIICHEALFWNHGDYTGWLEQTKNSTYLEKTALLDRYGIVVWRDHDHVHSGIPLKDHTFVDGIFYGLAVELGWENAIVPDPDMEIAFDLPQAEPIKEVASHIVKRLGLNGTRIIGSPETMVKKIAVPTHIFSDAKPQITKANEDHYDAFMTMELIDFTLSEFIRDASQLGKNKAIIAVGHFNLEEAGMKYMTTYLPGVIGGSIPVSYVQSGDMYHYVVG